MHFGRVLKHLRGEGPERDDLASEDTDLEDTLRPSVMAKEPPGPMKGIISKPSIAPVPEVCSMRSDGLGNPLLVLMEGGSVGSPRAGL
jgi:hypothetical protein